MKTLLKTHENTCVFDYTITNLTPLPLVSVKNGRGSHTLSQRYDPYLYDAPTFRAATMTTQSTSSADSADWSCGSTAVVSGSGAEKLLLSLLLF